MMNYREIENLDSPELDVYARLSEVQLLRYFEPKPGIFIAESANVILRALEAGYEPLSFLVERGRLEKEAYPVFQKLKECFGKSKLEELPIHIADHEIVTELTGYSLVRGLWGVFRRKELQGLCEFCAGKNRIAVLYDVVNPTNVGAIIRSAAALGMDGALLTRGTVNPLTRRSARVSMGTVFQIPWTVASREESQGIAVIETLHDLGYRTVAMALTDDSVGVDAPGLRSADKLAIVLGTEGYGLPDEVINACSDRVKIPMYHGVDSLNVAAASAVAFWELGKGRGKG